MKNKFSFVLTVVFLMSMIACTKTANTTDPNPNITISGSTTDLVGASKAFYMSTLNNDSIVLVNSNATSSSVLTSLPKINSLPSSVNFLSLEIISNNTISQNTYSYSLSSSNLTVIGVFQINGTKYSSLAALPCSVTIDTLNNTFVSGRYNATVANLTNTADYSHPVITGRFRAYF